MNSFKRVRAFMIELEFGSVGFFVFPMPYNRETAEMRTLYSGVLWSFDYNHFGYVYVLSSPSDELRY